MSYQDWQRMAGRDLDDAKEARALRVENAELEAALRLSREAIQNLVDTENILRTQLAREVDRARLQLSQLARTRDALTQARASFEDILRAEGAWHDSAVNGAVIWRRARHGWDVVEDALRSVEVKP